MKSLALLSICVLLVLSACGGNPFAPPTQEPDETLPPEQPVLAATTPEIFLDNLASAMRNRDKELYESLLDKGFWFTETNCLGEVEYNYDLEEELAIMIGSRDGSQKGIFDEFRDFTYDFKLIDRDLELGPEYPEGFPGDPDGHPDEDWEIFYGQVQMELLRSRGEGFRVDQRMTYKLRLDPDDGLWKIVRWIDDALEGNCGEAGKRSANAFSWAALKQQIAP